MRLLLATVIVLVVTGPAAHAACAVDPSAPIIDRSHPGFIGSAIARDEGKSVTFRVDEPLVGEWPAETTVYDDYPAPPDGGFTEDELSDEFDAKLPSPLVALFTYRRRGDPRPIANGCWLDRRVAELRRAAAAIGASPCPVGRRVGRRVVVGCGTRPISGDRFRFVATRKGRFCASVQPIGGGLVLGCADGRITRGGVADIDARLPGLVHAVIGTAPRTAVSVALHYRRGGVELSRAAAVVSVRRRSFKLFLAEAPADAVVLGVTAR